ncbi:TraB/GumN family protein [Candidatus Woesearchaeota archaeon]|nr:TraB/GumN family protein [Candidatus Woesearchaeota archaeon]
MENLRIIGTSHIAAESVDAVNKYIKDAQPDIVAIELDRRRANALLHGQKSRLSPKLIKVIGVKGFLFMAIAAFLQRKLGNIVGVEPGSEMKAALTSAIKSGARVALIDRHIEVTMKRLSQTLTWKERFRFVMDIFSGFSGEMKELGSVDLRKVPAKKIIDKVLQRLKNHYPNLYKVLVEERNEHMAAALADIMHKNPDSKILAVVGAGHEEELANLVKRNYGESSGYSFSAG